MPDKGYILLITVAADWSLQRTMISTTPEKKTDSRYWTHSEHAIEVQHEMQRGFPSEHHAHIAYGQKKCQSIGDFSIVSRLISNSFHLYLRHDPPFNSLVNVMKMLTFLKHVDVEFYACLINDSFGLLLVAKVV